MMVRSVQVVVIAALTIPLIVNMVYYLLLTLLECTNLCSCLDGIKYIVFSVSPLVTIVIFE
jgi:hypothetical protein